MSTSANRASSNGASDTALHGQIDAIGIFDLLRIAVTQQSTGRLLLFTDDMDAELFYERGRLTAAICGSECGAKVLSAVIKTQRGEFEYIRGVVAPTGKLDEQLHEVLIAAIKEHYRAKVGARRGSVENGLLPYVSGVHPVAARSVDSGWPDPGQEPYPCLSAPPNGPVSVPSPSLTSVPLVGQLPLARGELGRAIADGTGRVMGRIGQITSHETICAAQIAELSDDLAADFAMENLQRFELHRSGKALLCRIATDGIHVARVDSAPELEAVWQGLES